MNSRERLEQAFVGGLTTLLSGGASELKAKGMSDDEIKANLADHIIQKMEADAKRVNDELLQSLASTEKGRDILKQFNELKSKPTPE